MNPEKVNDKVIPLYKVSEKALFVEEWGCWVASLSMGISEIADMPSMKAGPLFAEAAFLAAGLAIRRIRAEMQGVIEKHETQTGQQG